MAQKTYTTEEKNAYFKSLRERWNKSKKLAEGDEVAKALYQEVGGDFSYASFYFTLMEMKAKKLDGVPYIDCKTFNGWRQAGFMVKKGEKSKIDGIVWLHPKDKDGEDDEDNIYPKIYKLFHKSQVDKIKIKKEVK